MSFPLGHLLPGNLAGRQGQVHNLGRNAITGSDRCHPELCVTQGVVQPSQPGWCCSLRALAVGTAGCLSTSLGGFQSLKASPCPPSSELPLRAGRASLCGMCDAKGRSEGWGATSWYSPDSLSLRVARDVSLCRLGLSLSYDKPQPPPGAGSSALLCGCSGGRCSLVSRESSGEWK